MSGFRLTILSSPFATLGTFAFFPIDVGCWFVGGFSRDHGLRGAIWLMLDDVAFLDGFDHPCHNLESCLVALGWDFGFNGALGGRTNMLNIPTSCAFSHCL